MEIKTGSDSFKNTLSSLGVSFTNARLEGASMQRSSTYSKMFCIEVSCSPMVRKPLVVGGVLLLPLEMFNIGLFLSSALSAKYNDSQLRLCCS
jgi:hypothetical protein